MKRLNRKQKALATFLCGVMLLASLFAADNIWSWGLFSVKAAAKDYSQARVKLTDTSPSTTYGSMGAPTSVSFTVKGEYSITGITDSNYSFRNGVLLKNGGSYKLVMTEGVIAIQSDEGTFKLGTDVTLYSHLAGRDYYLTVSNPTYGNCNYIGNMRAYVEGGTIALINTLHLDDYLCGVIAYEMSNGQQVESLKVQAVCARSYAYNLIRSRQGQSYDFYDTTYNQVYKGYRENYGRCIKAVDETAYQVLTYDGSYISTYYSSSNGGLTAHNGNAWGSTKLPWLNANVDEYDKVYQDRVTTISQTSISGAFLNRCKSALQSGVEGAGYDFGTLQIVSMDSVVVTYFGEPVQLAEDERRVYSATVSFTLKAKRTDGSQEYETFTQSIVKYRENARTLFGISSTKFKVIDNGSSFSFVVDGNGHGVGMSQNGTYARVAAGQTYSEILQFYFNKTAIKTLNYETYIYQPTPTSEYLYSQTSGINDLETLKVAVVTGDTHLYAQAGAIYDRVVALAKDARVTVVAAGQDWYKVIVGDDEYTGFVQKKYISIPEEVVIENVPGVYDLGMTNKEVSIRNAPAFDDSNIVATMPADSQVIIATAEDAFYKIAYMNGFYYVAQTEVDLTGLKSYAIFESEVLDYRVPLYESADVNSQKVGFLNYGTFITVFDVSDDRDFVQCMHDGKYVYLLKDGLDISMNILGYIVPEKLNFISLNVKITSDTSVFSSSNLADGTQIAQLVAGDIVKATQIVGNAYKIVYGDAQAYISMDAAKEHSKTVVMTVATAVVDNLLYSSIDMERSTGVLPEGETAELIGESGDIAILRYNSGIYYTTSADLVMSYKEIYTFILD
ncbi:MAG: SpoIID/LytB domain-containing protein [Clostridia bacterium]|nr:SpoIID/LytB domain-containing protein [Clostridia bacterium]